MSTISIISGASDKTLGARIENALGAEGHTVVARSSSSGDQAAPDAGAITIAILSAENDHDLLASPSAKNALARGSLIPVAIGGVTPKGLGAVQPIDLTGWAGDTSDPRWRFILDEISMCAARDCVEDQDPWATDIASGDAPEKKSELTSASPAPSPSPSPEPSPISSLSPDSEKTSAAFAVSVVDHGYQQASTIDLFERVSKAPEFSERDTTLRVDPKAKTAIEGVSFSPADAPARVRPIQIGHLFDDLPESELDAQPPARRISTEKVPVMDGRAGLLFAVSILALAGVGIAVRPRTEPPAVDVALIDQAPADPDAGNSAGDAEDIRPGRLASVQPVGALPDLDSRSDLESAMDLPRLESAEIASSEAPSVAQTTTPELREDPTTPSVVNPVLNETQAQAAASIAPADEISLGEDAEDVGPADELAGLIFSVTDLEATPAAETQDISAEPGDDETIDDINDGTVDIIDDEPEYVGEGDIEIPPEPLTIDPFTELDRIAESAFSASFENAALGIYFRDCVDCPDMAEIPAGEFSFGAPASEIGYQSSEGPATSNCAFDVLCDVHPRDDVRAMVGLR